MKMNAFLIFLRYFIFLNFLLKYCESGNVQWQYFYRVGSGAILGDEYRSENGTVTRLDCLSKCLSCHAVLYNNVTKECRHYTRQNSTLIPHADQSGISLWISQNMKISVAKYEDSRLMTFTEAGELCQSLGSRLATYHDLSNVQKTGYHLCCCGWLGDQTSRAPLYYDDSTCDIAQTSGMHTCKIFVDGQRVYETHYRAAYCIFSD